MTTRQADRFGGLDFLRGIAILAVLSHHILYEMLLEPKHMEIGWAVGVETIRVSAWWQWLFYPCHFGGWGVTLFFVISGFCIHWSYLQWTDKHPFTTFWPQYLVRRFCRIYPPYLASIIMIVVIGVLFMRPRNLPGMRDLILHLLMVHNLSQESFFTLTGSFWSLAVESQLYLVYPLFLVFSLRLGFPVFLLLNCALQLLPVAWHLINGNPFPFWVSQLPFFYWFTWGLGAAIAEWRFHGHDVQSKLGYFLWPLVLIALVAAHFRMSEWVSGPAIAIVSAVLVDRTLGAEVGTQSTLRRSLKWIGVMSYSIYLFHGPLLQHFTALLENYVFGTKVLPLVTVGAMFCCIVIAGISKLAWRLIEVPSQNAGKMLVKRLGLEV